MRANVWRNLFAVASLLGAVAVGSAAFADDDKPADEKSAADKPAETKRTEVRVVAIPNVGKHWIGVHAMPVTDEALKSQLNLQDRLIVVQVLPDSPAAKAGVQQHDILLKIGDGDVHTIEDLIKGVSESGEKEIKLLLLRGGKEQAISVKPAERPSDEAVARIHERVIGPEDLRVWLGEHGKVETDGQGRFTLRMLGPGITAAQALGKTAEFPNGLSISVSKENDQPAKIVAKKDGKTYETTEDKLGELPEDIRGHVERLLHARQPIRWSSDAWKKHEGKAAVEEEVKKAIESAKKQALEQRARAENEAKAVQRRIEIHRSEAGAVETLRKELEALKKEVENLKGSEKGAKNDSDKQ
jgi:hypothetical protein